MAQDPNNLIWIDMEMSGLNPETERILEVALVVSKRYGFKLKEDDQDNVKVFRSLQSLAATVAERRTK